MKVRMLVNTVWGPAGSVIDRKDKAFLKWCKENPPVYTECLPPVKETDFKKAPTPMKPKGASNA